MYYCGMGRVAAVEIPGELRAVRGKEIIDARE